MFYWAACALFVGCTSTPSPSVDFGAISIPEIVATQPVAQPSVPQLIECVPGKACLVGSELDLYEQVLIVSQANHDIAAANADALDLVNVALHNLLEAGKQANVLHELQMNQVEWRLDEKQKDVWTAYGIILVLGLALAL